MVKTDGISGSFIPTIAPVLPLYSPSMMRTSPPYVNGVISLMNNSLVRVPDVLSAIRQSAIRQLLLKQYPTMDRKTDGPASVKMPSSRHPEIDRFQSSRQDLSPKKALPSGSVVACGMPGVGDSVRARWVTLRGTPTKVSSTTTLNFRRSFSSTA